jgi:hypothetical protein
MLYQLLFRHHRQSFRGSIFQSQRLKNAPLLCAQELQIHLSIFVALIDGPRSMDEVDIDYSIRLPLSPLKYDSRPCLLGNA